MTEEPMNADTQAVGQARLDSWRLFCHQTRTDMFTLGQLVAGGQKEAALMLIAAVRTSAIVCGLDMEGAGASTPDGRPRPPDGAEVLPDDDQ